MKKQIVIGLLFYAALMGFSAFTPYPALSSEGEENTYHQDLCPLAHPVERIRYNNRIIQVPQNNEAVGAQLDKIRASDPDESRTAIISLAMAGNIDAFTELLALKNSEKLRAYCSYYQNSNDRKCIAPVIEQAIIDNFEDPALSESLLQVLRKNLYQQKSVFEKLLTKKLDPSKTREFELAVNALVATNLPGIEKQMLDHAMEYAASMDRKFWWSAMPVDRHYMDFFVQRHYEPCFKFIEKILNDAHYSTVPETYKVHLYNRQRALYYQLDKFSSVAAGDIFINQLSKLVNLPYDKFYDLELEAAGKYAISHAQTSKQRNRVAGYLTTILKTNISANKIAKNMQPARSKDDYHYKVYCRVIGLLAQSQTDQAASVLIHELSRLADAREDRRRSSEISQVLTGLSAFPESVNLDVPEFLDAVSALKEYDRSLTVVMILEKHPHPKGLEHLLSDLEYVISIRNTPGISYGMSNSQVFGWFINLLLTFDQPDYLDATRQEIDRLYQEQKLDVDQYESVSRLLNDLIGNESSVFTAMSEQQEEEEKKRKQALAAQQGKIMWDDFQSQIAYHMSPEGIQQDLDSYSKYSNKESMAVNWLVMAGTNILPHAHDMLLDEKTNLRLKFKLITLLGIIGDSRSIDPILAVLKTYPEMIHKDVFLALSQIPETDAAYEFFDQQIIQPKTPLIRQSALIYFAIQQDPRASQWVSQFKDAGGEPNLQSAALFLAARLGDKNAEKQIIALLQSRSAPSMEPVLLRALAELVPPDVFLNVLEKAEIDPASPKCRNMLILSGFRHATNAEKTDVAEKLLKSEYLWDRRDAVRYLIDNHQVDILQKYILADKRVEMPFILEALYSPVGQLMVLEASKMGYLIKDVDGDLELTRK